MSLKKKHLNEILEIGHKRFRVPKIYDGKSKKDNEGGLAEDYLKEAEENWSSEEYESSDSGDDEIFAYWLNDDNNDADDDNKEQKEVKEKENLGNYGNEAAKEIQSGSNDQIVEPKIEQELPEPKEENKVHTHVLYFPLYKHGKFKRRCNNWKKDVLKSSPALEEHMKMDQNSPKFNIIPLTLSDFQLDIVTQVLQNFVQAHPECKIGGKSNKGRSNKKNRIRLDITGIDFKSDSNDVKMANLAYTRAKPSGDFENLESIINSLVSNLIELGIVNDSNLEGARFDLSSLKYKLENPIIELLSTTKGVFDAGNLIKKFGDYSFGYVDVESVVLGQIVGDYVEEVVEADLK